MKDRGNRVSLPVLEKRRPRKPAVELSPESLRSSLLNSSERVNSSQMNKSYKVRLAKALGKIQLYKQQRGGKMTKLTLQLLECLANTENAYQDVFQTVYSHIIKQFFVDSTDLGPLYSYADSDSLTAKQLLSLQLKHNSTLQDQWLQKTKSIKLQLVSTQDQLARKENTLAKLKEQIEYYKSRVTILSKQNQSLRQTLAKKEESQSKLRKELQVSEVSLKNSFLQKDEMHNEIFQLKQQVTVLQENEKKLKGNMFSDKEKAFRTFTKSLHSMVQKMIIRLKGLSLQIKQMKQQRYRLHSQLDRLSVRASQGFDNLTPRPNWHKLYPKYKPEMRTAALVEKLMEKEKRGIGESGEASDRNEQKETEEMVQILQVMHRELLSLPIHDD